MSKARQLHAAVIGQPVAHSLSPLIHRHWMAEHGIGGFYETRDIAPRALKKGVAQMIKDGLHGFNVTLPHKETIIKHCKHLCEATHLIGAVNTVLIDETGALYGTNTDADGFFAGLRAFDSEQACLRGRVVILGAGGAARAIAFALEKAGVRDIVIVNRTLARAEKLALYFDATAHEWDALPDVLDGATLLVNATSCGMEGADAFDEFVFAALPRLPAGAVVCDIVYKPRRTRLLQAADDLGYYPLDGLNMLLHQAAYAFEIWTGILPEVTPALKEKVAEAAQGPGRNARGRDKR